LEDELKKAVDDLHAQEKAYQDRLDALNKASTDPNSALVAKNKASAELAQLKQEDPLPLRRAKITQEAALRKVEKQRKTVENALQDTENKAADAEKYLEEVSSKGGAAHGAIWWMQRELKEAQKYLPKKKQG